MTLALLSSRPLRIYSGAGFFAVHGNFTKRTALFPLFPVRNLYDSKIQNKELIP